LQVLGFGRVDDQDFSAFNDDVHLAFLLLIRLGIIDTQHAHGILHDHCLCGVPRRSRKTKQAIAFDALRQQIAETERIFRLFRQA
jgi:hypothetical protein